MPPSPPEGLLVTCGSSITAEGKVTGLDPEQIAALAELEIDYLLLEGDGAAGALLKAPAAYEPVIPPQTTLVVTVAGLTVVGRPLAAPLVHRPPLLAGCWSGRKGKL
jgi:molybdenum cofactor cytidylyltransferase